ncbi:hypothetical protein K501DRAFT_233480 [Backusella circina FSU 941]|nr:hypothetical protein K501DRAFT_233480 [Backusella circina FSU 941]
MSLSRPRNRVNSRANTLPSLLTTVEANNVDSSSFLPSIEESLQDWLTRSIPDTASTSSSLLLLETCPCCKKVDCENMDTLASAIRKLEGDARLAAEIGQSLLHKHEQSVITSTEIKSNLEEQLGQLREKVRELEHSLLEADIKKQELEEEKDKSIWEYQKTQKTLDETVIDLEAANHRCIQLGSELKQKSSEVDALRVFKIMARQADIREDALRVMLEDNKHELGISRKKELSLESKHRKLKAKYESLCIAYERIKLNQQEMGLTNCTQLDIMWLRESNEKLRKDVLKLTSALLSPGDAHMTHQNQLVELIKELASANTKLKNDLLDCRDLFVERYGHAMPPEIVMTTNNDGDNNTAAEENPPLLSKSAPDEPSSSCRQDNNNDPSSSSVSLTLPPSIMTSSTSSHSLAEPHPTPSTSSVNPSVVHHHYHYYLKNNKALNEKGKLKDVEGDSNNSNDPNEKKETPEITLSPSPINDTSSPFRQLHVQISVVLQRLKQTDIRALNRRLRRAFDMLELSSMSNSIIENILHDMEGLRSRFLWIEETKEESWVNDVSMLEFFPMMGLFQDMMREISQLRTTMNDLQVEYYKKVEESDIRLEEELKRKQQEKEQKRKSSGGGEVGSPLSWLANVFQRASQQQQKYQQQEQQQKSIHQKSLYPSQSQDSLHTRFIMDTTPVHPLAIPSSERLRKKSDMDRHGPASSFPRSFEKPSSKKKVILRASQSAGTTMQPALEYAVRRKRSTLGLESSNQASPDLAFGTTNWLGNK